MVNTGQTNIKALLQDDINYTETVVCLGKK